MFFSNCRTFKRLTSLVVVPMWKRAQLMSHTFAGTQCTGQSTSM